MFRELATNALKYGAFSTAAGRLSVGWRRVGADRFRLEWRESGVSVLSRAPRRSGFGTELITRRVPFELSGVAELTFNAGGLVCTLELPIDEQGPTATEVSVV